MAIVDSDFDTMYEIVAMPWPVDDLHFVPRAFTQSAEAFPRTVVALPRPIEHESAYYCEDSLADWMLPRPIPDESTGYWTLRGSEQHVTF